MKSIIIWLMWSAEFQRGRDSVENVPRQGYPADVISQEMIDPVETLVLNDRRIKVVELVSECGISNGSVYTTIHEHLGMSKVSANQVGTQKPEHAISSAKGRIRSRASRSVQCQSRRFSQSYETGLHHWDPDTKKESMQ
ncbi:MAG: hypothetical protein AB2693_33875 [Candidatus Thiodiazotropha sp.]